MGPPSERQGILIGDEMLEHFAVPATWATVAAKLRSSLVPS